MPTGKYAHYLEDRNDSDLRRSPKYTQRLVPEAQEPNRWSTAAIAAGAVGLGLAIIGGIHLRPAQKALSRAVSHLPKTAGPMALEAAVLQRYYDKASISRAIFAEARRQALVENVRTRMGESAARDLRRVLNSLYKAPDAARFFSPKYAQELAVVLREKRFDPSRYGMSFDNFAAHLSEFLQLTPDETTIVRQRIKVMMQHYDDELIRKFTRRTGTIFGLKRVTVSDVLEGRVRGFEFSDLSFLRDGIYTPRQGKLAEGMLRSLVKQDERFGQLIIDPALYMTKTHDIVDFRSTKRFLNKVLLELTEFHAPFVNISPLDLFGITAKLKAGEKPFMRIIPAGTPQFALGANVPVRTRDVFGSFDAWKMTTDAVFIGDKLWSLADPHVMLAKGIDIIPSWSRLARTLVQVAGVSTQHRMLSSGLLDVGTQEHHSLYEKIHSLFTKGRVPYWEGNLLRNIQRAQSDIEAYGYAQLFRRFLEEGAEPVPDDVFMAAFGKKIRAALGDIDLTTDQGIIQALYALRQHSNQLTPASRDRLMYTWHMLSSNPELFTKEIRFLGNKMPEIGLLELFRDVKEISKIQDVKRLVQDQIIELLYRRRDMTHSSIIGALMKAGGDNLDTSAAILRFAVNTYNVSDLQDVLTHTPLAQLAEDFTAARAPWYSWGKMQHTAERMLMSETSWLMVRKPIAPPHLLDMWRAMSDKSAAKMVKQQLLDSIGQLWAGRGHMDRFTALSAMLYNIPFGRINDALAFFGVGLGPRNTGSAAMLYLNLVTRRYLPAILGVGLAGYASWEMGNIFGKEGDELLADLKQNIKEDLAWIRDQLGITTLMKRIARITPGSELIWEIPGLSFIDPTKSLEEVQAEVNQLFPVRKGRYWILGNTPIQGGKIMYYMPHSSVLARADYKFTDVLYGSEEEYYAHAWFPTPRYPLAPIRYWITDRYHWEEKHYHDRPYPVTGPIPEIDFIPVFGPLISATVGRIIKPPRSMHVDEMEQYYAGEAGFATAGGAQGLYVHESPSGNIAIVVPYGPRRLDGSIPTASEVGIYAAGSAMAARSYSPHGKYTARTDGPVYEEYKHLDETYIVGRPYAIDDEQQVIGEAERTYGIKYTAARVYYGLTEMGGIYGFIAESITGQPYEEIRVIQDASRMTAYDRSFWDLELGGLGGEFNEIGRRFIPRPRRYDEDLEFNPLRNQMPSWMPGEDYFTDFKHGDPYIKVPRGEMRLPGGGYEAVYNYHPEQMIVEMRDAVLSTEDIARKLIHQPLPYSEEARYFRSEDHAGVHTHYYKKWREEGILESQVELAYDELSRTVGQYDAIIREGRSERRIVDIKTLTPERFDALMQRGAPFDEHIDMATLYMHATGIKKAGILYVEQTPEGIGREYFAKLDYDESVYQDILARVEGARQDIWAAIESGRISKYELYDPLNRFLILADVAPYSKEYQYYRDLVTEQYKDLTGISGPERRRMEAAKATISAAKRRVSAAKQKNRFFERRFSGIHLTTQKVTITDVLGHGVFLTEEFGDTPIKMAGISISQSYRNREVREKLEQILAPGKQVVIGISAHEASRISSDSIGSMRAVVYHRGKNLNLELIRSGDAKEDVDDWSDVGVVARFSPAERFFGRAWEWFAHLDTPFHTKFLQVRTPLESYKRREVYGKSFQAWSIKDQLIPTLESIAAKNPFSAAAMGGFLGGMIYGRTLRKKIIGVKVGAAIGLGLSLGRIVWEKTTGQKYIPARRIKEREINEYFDILQYIKYKGLYEKVKQKALEEEGFDVDAYFEELEEKRRLVREKRKELLEQRRQARIRYLRENQEAIDTYYEDLDTARKRRDEELRRTLDQRDRRLHRQQVVWSRIRRAMNWMYRVISPRDVAPRWFMRITSATTGWVRRNIQKATKERYRHIYEEKRAYWREHIGNIRFSDYVPEDEELKRIREELDALSKNEQFHKLGPWSMTAIAYRQKYESTLYGAGPGTPISAILSAMPDKEREYFLAFLDAKPEEREEILDLVPHNQRRFLQAAWGMEPDQPPVLEEYFDTHFLPPPDWEGWSAHKDLDDIKINVIKKEGLDLSEFGFWKEDLRRAEEHDAPYIPINYTDLTEEEIREYIRQILSGQNLDEIDIEIMETDTPGLDIDIDVYSDRREDIVHYLNHNMDVLL